MEEVMYYTSSFPIYMSPFHKKSTIRLDGDSSIIIKLIGIKNWKGAIIKSDGEYLTITRTQNLHREAVFWLDHFKDRRRAK